MAFPEPFVGPRTLQERWAADREFKAAIERRSMEGANARRNAWRQAAGLNTNGSGHLAAFLIIEELTP
jgi:hypothetical protein